MAVTGTAGWYISILVFSRGFYVYRIDRDEDEFKALIEREHDFWYHVDTWAHMEYNIDKILCNIVSSI